MKEGMTEWRYECVNGEVWVVPVTVMATAGVPSCLYFEGGDLPKTNSLWKKIIRFNEQTH